METSTEKAKLLCNWGMNLYYAEVLYSLYLDRSLLLFLMRLLFAKSLADFVSTGNMTPQVEGGTGSVMGVNLQLAGNNGGGVNNTGWGRRRRGGGSGSGGPNVHAFQPIKVRVMASCMLALFGVLFHFPYDGSPALYQRELFVDILAHTKFLTFTAVLDRYSGLQLLLIDVSLCLLRIFMLSLSMVASGASDPVVVSMGHPGGGYQPKSPDGSGSPESSLLTSIVTTTGSSSIGGGSRLSAVTRSGGGQQQLDSSPPSSAAVVIPPRLLLSGSSSDSATLSTGHHSNNNTTSLVGVGGVDRGAESGDAATRRR